MLDDPHSAPVRAPAPQTALLERLEGLTEALPESLAPVDAAAEIVARSLHLIQADVGFVATESGDGRELSVRRVTR